MIKEQTDTPRHPIRVVARRTGLTPAVLRAWEKRYGVVDPSRSEGGQRLYSDQDVHRLSLLQRVVEEGRNISHVAGLSLEELQGLVQEDEAERKVPVSPSPMSTLTTSEVLTQALAAVDRMEPEALEKILTRGALTLPVPSLLTSPTEKGGKLY